MTGRTPRDILIAIAIAVAILAGTAVAIGSSPLLICEVPALCR